MKSLGARLNAPSIAPLWGWLRQVGFGDLGSRLNDRAFESEDAAERHGGDARDRMPHWQVRYLFGISGDITSVWASSDIAVYGCNITGACVSKQRDQDVAEGHGGDAGVYCLVLSVFRNS